jgi:hypothetical protein
LSRARPAVDSGSGRRRSDRRTAATAAERIPATRAPASVAAWRRLNVGMVRLVPRFGARNDAAGTVDGGLTFEAKR